MINVKSYIAGSWVEPDSSAQSIRSAVTGDVIARAGCEQLDIQSMLYAAREKAAPALRQMTFHFNTGATRADSVIDIDGGIGTVFVYASKARRELPDDHILMDGATEQLSRNGTFLGQHIYTSKRGVAVQINAFNFPVWGMLEKLAPALLAGVPSIIKPATVSSYVTEACFKLMVESKLFPEGSMQLIAGRPGDLFEHLTAQDQVGFTGSAATAFKLRSNPHLMQNSIAFNAEQDSLNSTVLHDDVADAVSAKLGQIKIGDPSLPETDMGPLVSLAQKHDVTNSAGLIAQESQLVFGDDPFEVNGADSEKGAFISPRLYSCKAPDAAEHVHSKEAFGPVATLMVYKNAQKTPVLPES